MTQPPKSLYRTLLQPVMLVCLAALAMGTFLSISVFRGEYDELLDNTLRARAELLLPLASARFDGDPVGAADPLLEIEEDYVAPQERSVFWLIGAGGQVLLQSAAEPQGLARVTGPGAVDRDGYRFFTTAPDEDGRRLTLAEPLIERNEAILESLAGTVLSMAILILLSFAIMRRSIRRVGLSLAGLSTEIESKSEFDLTPITRQIEFAELAPAVRTLNDLMLRLDRAVTAERNFATTAAHELRTPLAVSLAQVQRLRAAIEDPEISERAKEIEIAIRKLIHLAERLLQFSRAQSGIGLSGERGDASPVIAMICAEAKERASGPLDIDYHPPTAPYLSPIDPDALAILLSNLIDNALKYATPGQPVILDARTPGSVTITNDCAPLTPQALARIGERHVRDSRIMEGFGLGLSIVRALCEQSGAVLSMDSPIPGTMRGFRAQVTLPS